MHEHDHHDDDSFGLALGFRIFDADGALYLAEAEISPYVDQPEALGVAIVFHPLDDIDPTADAPEAEVPGHAIDIDEALVRDESGSMREQFREIVRQLAGISVDELREYLRMAQREEAGSGEH